MRDGASDASGARPAGWMRKYYLARPLALGFVLARGRRRKSFHFKTIQRLVDRGHADVPLRAPDDFGVDRHTVPVVSEAHQARSTSDLELAREGRTRHADFLEMSKKLGSALRSTLGLSA